MECYSKRNDTQNGMSLKWNLTKNQCYSNWNVTQIKMSLKMECHSNLNVTQIGRLNRLEEKALSMSLREKMS